MAITTNNQTVCAAFEKRQNESELCFWNLNRNQINTTQPHRQITAPGHVRAISFASSLYLIACGFTNGDIRLLDLETEGILNFLIAEFDILVSRIRKIVVQISSR